MSEQTPRTLPQRLRDIRKRIFPTEPSAGILIEAAARIERLERELATLKQALLALADEIERYAHLYPERVKTVLSGIGRRKIPTQAKPKARRTKLKKAA